MTQGFFQFNNSIINEIYNFSNSAFDLLFMSGKKGAAKSETIEKAIEELQENNLIFRHFCFKNTVIDDFLLNFYDALRNFSLAQKIALKKIATNNFKEKISHYFKAIEQNCVILVENFENIDENVEIVDFLSYLASFKNVKIIIVTRNSEVNLFRFKKIKIQNLDIKSISKDDFKAKLVLLSQPLEDDFQEKFYEATQGLEVFLKMAVKYCSVTDISIIELLNEFERKNNSLKIDFEEFIVLKFITLIPKPYQEFFNFMAVISVPVSIEFIANCKLLNYKEAISYLSKNLLVSFFNDEVYIKDYLRKHIVGKFSVQEKVTNYKKFIEIFEKELEKSPKDRLIRLSRESIRKEIEEKKNLMPAVNSAKNTNSFAYMGMSAAPVQDEKARNKAKLAEKFNKIKEKKERLKKTSSFFTASSNQTEKQTQFYESNDENRQDIVRLINSAREYSREYRYNDAIQELLRAKDIDETYEFEIEILLLLGKNYEYLNNYDFAQKNYNIALNIAIENKDDRKTEIEYLIAMISKNLYKLTEAKNQFLQIALNETKTAVYRRNSHINLGEIYESEQNFDEAIKHYLEAINLSLGKDKQTICKAYYKLALLYDGNGDYQSALKYYQKNYTTSSEVKENEYYSASLLNSAMILNEESRYREAIDCLKLALNFEAEKGDCKNLYFTQKELARTYSYIDETYAITYYKQALNTAKTMNDAFDVALVYFEVAEYYYDKAKDDRALLNFLNAKAVLSQTSDKENIARIDLRIKDIRLRLDEETFKIIMEKYDN